jgi:protein-S-isoprenylcysteine O-methyltransferase Ste14
MFGRVTAFAFGVGAYLASFATLLYFMGWIAGVGVPVPLDSPASVTSWRAVAIDLGLLAMFALQHSVMARPRFKAWWTRFVPGVVERSDYVLVSSVALFAVMAFWQPLGGVVWSVGSDAWRIPIYGVFVLGWAILFLATFLLNHFDLFGLRQVWLHFVNRPYTQLAFDTPFLYRIVRHPLYVGWLLIFWATPTMTVAHLLLATTLSAYILIAIQFEERDLLRVHREYAGYRHRVPMLIPRLGKPPAGDAPAPFKSALRTRRG